MPHKISYDVNISRESRRFKLQTSNDNNSNPIMVVDNSNNHMDLYQKTFTSLPNTEKRIFSSRIVNSEYTEIKTNTLDILASDVHVNGEYLFFKHILKRSDFTKILINNNEHSVIINGFVYTNEKAGNVDYFNDDKLIFSERLEKLQVFINDRSFHLKDLIPLDGKYFSINTDLKEITLTYSSNVYATVGDDKSIFSFNTNNKSLNLNGFLYRHDVGNMSVVYNYADYIPNIKRINNAVIDKIDHNKIYLGYNNVIPESVIINIFSNQSNYPAINGIPLHRIVINENVDSTTDEIRFQFEYVNEGDTYFFKEILSEKSINRTDGFIYFSLPEHLKSDDIYIEASFSYLEDMAISVPIVRSDLIDGFISPTTIIKNNNITNYDKNLIIKEIFKDSFNFENGIPQYTFQAVSAFGYGELGFGEEKYGGLTDNIEDEVIVSANNPTPIPSSSFGFGINEYSSGNYGGSIFDFSTAINDIIDAKYTYKSNIINIFSAEKINTFNADIYVSNNISRPINSEYKHLSNYKYNIIHRSLLSETDIIVAAGINKLPLNEGLYIDGKKLDQDNDFIYIEFDVNNLMLSPVVVTSDIKYTTFNTFFDDFGDFSFDAEKLMVFSSINGTIEPINDLSIQYYITDENKLIVSFPIGYSNSTVGLGYVNNLSIIKPKALFQI